MAVSLGRGSGFGEHLVSFRHTMVEGNLVVLKTVDRWLKGFFTNVKSEFHKKL